jgi:hypothetical protein
MPASAAPVAPAGSFHQRPFLGGGPPRRPRPAGRLNPPPNPAPATEADFGAGPGPVGTPPDPFGGLRAGSSLRSYENKRFIGPW